MPQKWPPSTASDPVSQACRPNKSAGSATSDPNQYQERTSRAECTRAQWAVSSRTRGHPREPPGTQHGCPRAGPTSVEATFAALRPGEAAGVRVGDIDFLRKTLEVARQVHCLSGGVVDVRAPKYGSERVIHLAHSLVDLLAEYVASNCTCARAYRRPCKTVTSSASATGPSATKSGLSSTGVFVCSPMELGRDDLPTFAKPFGRPSRGRLVLGTGGTASVVLSRQRKDE